MINCEELTRPEGCGLGIVDGEEGIRKIRVS